MHAMTKTGAKRPDGAQAADIMMMKTQDPTTGHSLCDLPGIMPNWHAAWTRSHCEKLVRDQLADKGFETFLPEITAWTRKGGVRCRTSVPMFPGYVLLRHAMDKESYIDAVKTRGLVRILGERWDRLAVIAEREVDSIRKVLEADLTPRPYPYMRVGQRVRIRGGPLAGVEGILLQTIPERGLLVLSIELFRRSIAVEVDCTLATAA